MIHTDQCTTEKDVWLICIYHSNLYLYFSDKCKELKDLLDLLSQRLIVFFNHISFLFLMLFFR